MDFGGAGLWPFSLMLAAVLCGLLLSRTASMRPVALTALVLCIFLGVNAVIAVDAVRTSDGGIDGAAGLAALVFLTAAVASGLLLLIERLQRAASRNDLNDS